MCQKDLARMGSGKVMQRLDLLVCVVVAAVAAKVNYADVRTQMSHSFEERAHEMTAVLGVLQDVSKATQAGIKAIEAKCGTMS